ncbi:MAG: peptidylprolyl isomerase [Acidobacteria bacterium]|nr:peptidylprolyl isomerase [Acidobacteriota bacterium]
MIGRTIAAVLVLIAASAALPPAGADPVPGAAIEVKDPAVVATIDGTAVPASLYWMYVKNGIEGLGLDQSTDQGRRKVALLKEGVLSELIDRTLIEIEGIRRKLPIPPGVFADRYRKWVAQMGGESRYRAYLGEHGLSDNEFRRTIAQELYGELLQKELTKDITVLEREARSFYTKEKRKPALGSIFTEPETVRAAHILIAARRNLVANEINEQKGLRGAALDAAVRDEMARRRDRAEELRRQATGGADFATLARQWSDDPGSREQGGGLGAFVRNTHTSRFDEAAFRLAPGAISGVVETQYGYHVIKVIDHRVAHLRTFEEAGPAIRERLLARKRAERLRSWLEDRRRHAVIRIEPFYAGQQSTVNSRPFTVDGRQGRADRQP